MILNNTITSLDILLDKGVDFYIGDDMFEIEGRVYLRDGVYYIDDLNAVDHILRVAGSKVIMYMKNDEIMMKNADTGAIFDCEINRVYDLLTDPKKSDIEKNYNNGFKQFFKKFDDITLAFNYEDNMWYTSQMTAEFPKGIINKYDSLDTLFNERPEIFSGSWQMIYYDSEWTNMFFLGGNYYG